MVADLDSFKRLTLQGKVIAKFDIKPDISIDDFLRKEKIIIQTPAIQLEITVCRFQFAFLFI